ncbi:MAG: hypothetical protein FJX89_10005 [Bacteroidetes bacterium]|nr:hypothetical protein [Bacteroidota bacterium]
MRRNESQRACWVGGLLVICAALSLCFIEQDLFWIPRKVRHVIKFATTISVYLLGTLHLGWIEDRWMSYLWHFIHLSLLTIVTGVGLHDWFGMVSKRVKDMTWTMKEFIIYPGLSVGMGILNRRLNPDPKP